MSNLPARDREELNKPSRDGGEASLAVGNRRLVGEWIGKAPDSKVPPHVRARIFERHGGICHISGRKIRGGEPWDLDHVIALRDGGEHREGNLAPALKDKHREKTAAEAGERARLDRIKAKHEGTYERRGPKIASRKNPWGWRPL